MLDLILTLPAILVGPQLRRNDYAPYVEGAVSAHVLYERSLQSTIAQFNNAAAQVLSEQKDKKQPESKTQ